MTAPARGHWPRGKRRSTISPPHWAALRQRVLDLVDAPPRYGPRSRAGLARHLGVDARTVRRWLAGEDFPGPDAMAAMRLWYRQHRPRPGRADRPA